jgi:hypothetical protein
MSLYPVAAQYFLREELAWSSASSSDKETNSSSFH